MNAPPDFSASRPAEELFKARVAVSIGFLLLGIGIGLWAVHIPIVQARLGIDNAVLGFALLSMAAGSVALMPLTGWAIARLGSRVPTAFLMIAFTALIPLPILAGSTVFLFVALFPSRRCDGRPRRRRKYPGLRGGDAPRPADDVVLPRLL